MAALPALAFLIEPGFDVSHPVEARAKYISDHSLWWRSAWLPWQLSALSDVLVSVALIRWLATLSNRPQLNAARRWAYVALGLNVVASVPEQFYEAVLVSSHVRLASDALSDPNQLERFADEQRRALWVTSVFSAGLYIAMTAAWHIAVTKAAGRPSGVKTFGGKALLVTIVFLGSATGFVAAQVWLGVVSDIAIQISGGIGFSALVIWSLSAADNASRARSESGESAHFLRWPNEGTFDHLQGVANSRGVRDLFRIIRFARLRSDIEDVVYLNWLVPTGCVQEILPEPLRCEDLDGLTAVSVLTYKHGSIGPRAFGPFRRLLPSPLQSNWRFYVEPVGSVRSSDAIYFFRTVLSAKLHVMLARLLADGLPAHLPAVFIHGSDGRTIRTEIDAGAGSSPGLVSEVTRGEITEGDPSLPPAWKDRFGTWSAAVTYLVDQNRGLQVDPDARVVRESTIEIPIALDIIRPAKITELTVSNLDEPLSEIVKTGTGFAFVVPAVHFEATDERVAARF